MTALAASATVRSIEFIDLGAQQARIKTKLDAGIQKVLTHGSYIMGPEVRQIEIGLEAFVGVKHCISAANGTDAMQMALMALGVGSGDAVIVPSFTFASTAEVVALVGATPVFVDVQEETFNLDPAGISAGVDCARKNGLRPVGVVPVDLFGQPADYDAIEPVCAEHGLWMMCDSAQGFGATYRGRRCGAIGTVATTSFFPAKPLGCYGDGGAVFTNDDAVADLLRSIRVHGKGSDKYDNVRIGMNGRLDTIQAAILLEKLAIYQDEIDARQMVAQRYDSGLAGVAATPPVIDGAISVWAQYTLRLGDHDRDAVQAALKSQGVPTAVYYPKPLHQQTAYRHYPVAGNGLPVSDKLAREVMSLPMHPYLSADDQDYIIGAVRRVLA